jgi:ATP-binding cassette, subfamily B, bacterial
MMSRIQLTAQKGRVVTLAAPGLADPPTGAGGGYRRFVQVALQASPALSIFAVVAVALAALAPLAVAAAMGELVDQVPRLAEQGMDSPTGSTAVWWAAAAGGLLLLLWAVGSLRTATAEALGDRIDAALQRELMDAVIAPPGIGHLEHPHTLDLINVGRETFRGSWGRPGRLALTVSGLVTGRVMLIGSCAMVAQFQPVLGAVLLAAGLWAAHEEKAASRVEAAHHYGDTETARRMEYYYELGATPPAAKEVRVFGLSGFLVDRFTATWRRSMDHVIVPLPARPLLATIALGAVVVGGLAWLGSEAAAGRIDAGPAAVCAQALMVSLSAMQQSSWTGLQTELALVTLLRYDQAVAAVRSAPETAAIEGVRRPVGDLPRREIRFEGVSFRYPGASSDALHGLDLVIPAGRSLAVVGANGAGKTTLVKLLCRLYEPSAGRITVDGVDLAGLETAAWRRRIAAAFQDATRFPLPARTNIAFGRIDAADDQHGIEAAAAAAGMADELAALPRGWDTPLSPEFADGIELSGGQWQKVALARALFAVRHGAGVLILDEPAAHLDARAEARLYERFLDMTRGLTTIVISHRFSTVRQASSIVVVDDGRVIEQGTHDELLAIGGAYAEMFLLQASRFADFDSEPEIREVTEA